MTFGIPTKKHLKKLIFLPFVLSTNFDPMKLLNTAFYGVFYYDTNKPQWGNKIYVVYKDWTYIPEMEKIYKSSDLSFAKYKECIDGTNYVIYAFAIAPQFKKDIQLLWNGKYDKISCQAKYKIREAWTGKTNEVSSKIICNYLEGWNTWNKPFVNVEDEQILNLNKVPTKKGLSLDYPLFFNNRRKIYYNHNVFFLKINFLTYTVEIHYQYFLNDPIA